MTQAQLPGMQQRPTGGDKEFYPTPPELCAAICKTLAELYERCGPRDTGYPGPRVIEPSAGSGNFVRAIRGQWHGAFISSCDVEPKCSPLCERAGANMMYRGDWVELAKPMGPAELILGNPPFSLAVPHVEAGLQVLVPGGLLAFLLRISIEEWTTKPPFPRRDFWPRYPLRARAPIAQRASFDGKGTDSTGYALFVWQKGFTGRGELLAPIDWKGT